MRPLGKYNCPPLLYNMRVYKVIQSCWLCCEGFHSVPANQSAVIPALHSCHCLISTCDCGRVRAKDGSSVLPLIESISLTAAKTPVSGLNVTLQGLSLNISPETLPLPRLLSLSGRSAGLFVFWRRYEALPPVQPHRRFVCFEASKQWRDDFLDEWGERCCLVKKWPEGKVEGGNKAWTDRWNPPIPKLSSLPNQMSCFYWSGRKWFGSDQQFQFKSTALIISRIT